MLTYFLFFFYLFTGTLLLHLIIRRNNFSFSIHHTTTIVFFKIFMGCLYGWVFLHFYGGDDTWNFFQESKEETNLLLQHPGRFFAPLWPSYSLEIKGYNGWEAFRMYVNDFERWFIIKSLAILNLLSGKNYYINVVFFEFGIIGGPLLLYKLLAREFPGRTGMYFLLIFFFPSIIFWTSGIRAEGLLLLFLVLMIYNGQAYARKPAVQPIIAILIGFLGVFLIRYQFLLVFLPAYAAYLISLKQRENSPRYFQRFFLTAGLIFFLSLFLSPRWQLSRPLQHAQASFFLLKGNTRYQLDSLKPGPIPVLAILPQAIANSTLRPYPWEGKSLLQSVSSVEVLFLVAGLFFFIVSPKRKQQISHPLYWLFLFYGLSQLIVIGMVVPFPGAIVRYRSLSFLFLILFFYAGNPLLQQKLRYWIFKLH